MIKLRHFTIVAALLCMVSFTTLQAQQINTPAPSPAAKLMQKVGLVDVTIDYSRPGKKGRDIFGNLVPYGKVWRTGANGATTLTVSDEVSLEGRKLPAGSYALYTTPGKDSWTVMVYNDLSLGGNVARYDNSKELARFTVKPMMGNRTVESFTIDINDITNNGATVYLMWDKTIVPIKMTVDTESQVLAQIDRFASNPTASLANDYFNAASYYYSLNKDLDKALAWVNEAIEIRENAFWMIRLKSQIQAAMGEYKDAIETAEESLKYAQQFNNADYVKLNTDAIAEWRKKK